MVPPTLPRSTTPPPTGIDAATRSTPPISPRCNSLDFSHGSLTLKPPLIYFAGEAPIGVVISLLQIEAADVGGRGAAGWCRPELQRVAVEQIPHMCRWRDEESGRKTSCWSGYSGKESR